MDTVKELITIALPRCPFTESHHTYPTDTLHLLLPQHLLATSFSLVLSSRPDLPLQQEEGTLLTPYSLRIYDSALSPRLVTPPSSPLPLRPLQPIASPETSPQPQQTFFISSRSLLDVSPFSTDRTEWRLDPSHTSDSLPPTSSSSRKRPVRTPSPPSPPIVPDPNPSRDPSFQSLKPRQRLIPAQQQILEAQFQLNPSPNAQTRSEIAQGLNVGPYRVKIWFRNRRIKLRGSVSQDTETLHRTSDISS